MVGPGRAGWGRSGCEGAKPGTRAEPGAASPARGEEAAATSASAASSPGSPAYPAVPKDCECGRAYTHEAWPSLRLIEFQRLEGDLAVGFACAPAAARRCASSFTSSLARSRGWESGGRSGGVARHARRRRPINPAIASC